jgi:photosystem II stability/assembly factor-like uncharacterized protein
VRSLVVDPNNSSTIYAGTDRGIVKSTNGGASWIGANTGLTLTNSWISMLAIDPVTSSALYAVTFGGLFKSTDGGASWNVFGAELVRPTGPQPISLSIDPVTPSTLYVVDWNGEISKSTDGGATWNEIKAGVPNTGFATQVLSLAIDSVTPTTTYTGSFGSFTCCPPPGNAGISKSTDGGQTWSAFNAGIPPGAFLRSLTVDPATPATIYGAYVSDGGWGVIKSTDAGESWSVTNTGLTPGRGSSALAIAPTAPSTIYAAYSDSGTMRGGVFKSTNGGSCLASSRFRCPFAEIRNPRAALRQRCTSRY